MGSRKPVAKIGPSLPPAHDWRTTDADEIAKRRQRALEESFQILNSTAQHPIFSNFTVKSRSGLAYSVEIREIGQRQFACTCVDFRINGLGTCKHVEAVLNQVQARFRRLFQAATAEGSTRVDLAPDTLANTLRVTGRVEVLPKVVRGWFDREGLLREATPEETVAAFEQLQAADRPEIRVSQEVEPWIEARRQAAERKTLRREYEQKVQSGEWPPQETLVPLFPYQREGMLHLAFTERALLADEMGLGKTIQAIAAGALLHRLGLARRVLVVTPASLKSEWEEQIQRFTPLPYRLVYGARPARLAAYAQDHAPFFTIVNYEQMLGDALEVNQRLQPDIVVLDEAQRIKNWNTKTSQAIKRLRSRFAFVLTGTPIENRIDELHSLMDFLNPSVLGPLFRFNREFYSLDDRGRPSGYKNLDQLHARIQPYLLRRRKAEVETELPERTDRNHFVALSGVQQATYEDHAAQVARLQAAAQRRPLTQQEQDKLMREMAMMRMICDTNYILDPNDRVCPKLVELEKILEECMNNESVKVIIFSEWERMLELVKGLCQRLGVGYAWHTGSVPQQRRRAEINCFKGDPQCRVFLSTESGGTGLNLQNASVVINCDLPWNPAKLEQRIARAWRKHQTNAVTVINLVSENTIEHRMLATLAGKQALADGVLELKGNITEIKLTSGRQAFLARLQQLMGPKGALPPPPPQAKVLPVDRALGFSREAGSRLGRALVACEERYPCQGAHSVLLVVVDGDAGTWSQKLAPLHEEYFAQGDPLAPVHLEVIDRATQAALERLLAAGLIAKTTRASRPLFPPAEVPTPPPPLTEAEQQASHAHREQAARKLKMARLLAGGGMSEEARPPLLDAFLSVARALAVEQRLPEPAATEEALLPPLALHWKNALPALRGYVSDPAAPWQPAAEALQQILNDAGSPS